nr:type II toxin-antitoxin system RelE/ParE family toxin [Synechococcus sp. CCY 9618]
MLGARTAASRGRSLEATVAEWLKSARQSGSSDGNPGDVKPVGPGVSELRINYGPGYRVCYLKRGAALIILLAGGDKSSQAKDIDEALLLADNLTEEI